ncbi:hypothetical protein RHA1_ro08925 (plasmid) [Rhodococcus jostii RHA1]|uniref:Uncharacterized protein n=1 Tax=Rhodococcus jostii (strain RHA1) TaxID=101510 RepID=Q0RXL7_RHOJR|nr:hypothetical protein RHA1_ro08925 [Rhodococcus jostii RHA1]
MSRGGDHRPGSARNSPSRPGPCGRTSRRYSGLGRRSGVKCHCGPVHGPDSMGSCTGCLRCVDEAIGGHATDREVIWLTTITIAIASDRTRWQVRCSQPTAPGCTGTARSSTFLISDRLGLSDPVPQHRLNIHCHVSRRSPFGSDARYYRIARSHSPAQTSSPARGPSSVSPPPNLVRRHTE